jgi:Short C-terminal domain
MRRSVVVGRRGPGLVGTVARTAVVAGTATVVAKGVSGSMDQHAAQQQAAAQQQQQDAYNAGVQQAQQESLMQQQQLLAAQAAAAQVTPTQSQPNTQSAHVDNMIVQLQKLGEMQQQGLLTPEEFAQQKARILGT